jgi:hypothetical protein
MYARVKLRDNVEIVEVSRQLLKNGIHPTEDYMCVCVCVYGAWHQQL